MQIGTPSTPPSPLQCSIILRDHEIAIQAEEPRIIAEEASSLYGCGQNRVIALLQRLQEFGANADLLFDLVKRQIAPLPGIA